MNKSIWLFATLLMATLAFPTYSNQANNAQAPKASKKPDNIPAPIELINPTGTETLYEQYKYSQAVVANGRVDVSGQVGVTAEMTVPTDLKEQVRLAFSNLKYTLEAAGSSLQHVTHLTMYFTNIQDSETVDEVFTEFFPSNYPARTEVQVVRLIHPDLVLEIQANAILK